MQLDEFKNLIEERKRLVHDIDRQKNFSRVQQIDKILCFDSWSKYHGLTYYKELYLDCMKSSYYRLFEIGSQNVCKILKKFFKDENAEIKYTSYPYREDCPIYLELITQKRTYDLGCDNNAFYCLFTDGRADWELLIHDYPTLRDYLWNEFSALRENEFNLLKDGEIIKARPISLIDSPEQNEERTL